MIILNLLPPHKKDQLLAEKEVARLKSVVTVLVVTCLLALALTVAGRFVVNSERHKIDREIDALNQSLTSGGHASTENLVKKINQKAASLLTMQTNYLKWSVVLSALAENTNPAIGLQSLTVSQKEKKFTLSGIAKTRADLVDFQQKLQKLPYLEGLALPISNLTKKENIPFEFSATFISEKMPGYEITAR